MSVERTIAEELGVRPGQVQAAVDLLDGGATVPFVARYRKEATGGLDDGQLRTLHERLGYLRELEDRRAVVLDSIRSQGMLTDELAARIAAADSKARLEDLYLPYRPKRRTKAQIAREAGLEPLADALLGDPSLDPATVAAGFVDAGRGVADAAAALEGARAVLVERFAEDADLAGELRERMWQQGRMVSTVRDGREEAGAKYADYFAFSEPLTKLPSHRVLALLRGEAEEVLDLDLDPEPAGVAGAAGAAGVAGAAGGPAVAGSVAAARSGVAAGPSAYERSIAARFGVADLGRPADRWLNECVRSAWRTRIKLRLSIDLRLRLREAAEDEAVRVFAANLRDLLLAAPAGTRPTMGLDPGYRTGTKVAVVDGTGRVVATDTVYPHKPQGRWDEALARLRRLAETHRVELVAIGNGTASRETEKLAAELVRAVPELQLTKAMVSEAGASVYSASAYAAEELPALDVTLRGAVSIARRLQDPLAELVKIDPKSIGVGQYQHDLTESKLSRSLDAVVEDCVNAVGVDVNTASVPLLGRVAGITPSLAANIVAHRDATGPFPDRAALRAVPRLGDRTFEQCAGFLRIRGGTDPLDASAVHPEAYPLVRKLVAAHGGTVDGLIGNSAVLRAIRPADFVDDRFGLPTVTDILAELDKPGRDPRPSFATATFAEGVDELADVRPGMVLEGVVTNVAAFGAFVDIGVHQDGLVHISAMSRKFVADPREVVKPGDVVKVKVLDVDLARKRVSLTLRLDDEVDAVASRPGGGGGGGGGRGDRGGRGSDGRGDRGGRGSGGNRSGGAKRSGGGSAGGSAAGGAPGGAMADALRRAGLVT